MSLRALLLDVGGTLLPDNLPESPELRAVRRARLAAVLPELGQDVLSALLAGVLADASAGRDRLEQNTNAEIANRLAAADRALACRADEVRRTLGRYMGSELRPFPGHRELLAAAGDLGLCRVLVTNTAWLADDDWLDWGAPELGLTGLVDGVVTSCSAGYRKPHLAMFQRAVALAGCRPEECLFVGNNERKDVEPALGMGMTTIRVAIQESPTATRAHRLATSLDEVTAALRAYSAAAPDKEG